MIKSENGRVCIKGRGIDILAEFTAIANGLIETMEENMPREKAIQEIEDCIEMAKMSREELHREALNSLKKIMSKIESLEQEDDEEDDSSDLMKKLMDSIMRDKK